MANNYVFVGDGGLIKTSTDGILWNTVTSQTSSQLLSVDYSNNLYIVGGVNGVLRTSTDSYSWDIQNTGTTITINAVLHKNNLLLIGGANLIRYSSNGVVWFGAGANTGSAMYDSFFGSNTHIYVGASGTIATAPGDDPYEWTVQTSGTSSNLFGVAYGTSTIAPYVAVGTGGILVTSTDAVTWTSRTRRTLSQLNDSVYGSDIGLYVIVGNSGNIYTSTDGIEPIAVTSGTASNLLGVAYGANTYVAVGAGGVVLTSTDGSTWNPSVSGNSSILNAVIYNGNNRFSTLSTNNLFIYGGASGAMATSTDGVTWVVNYSGTVSTILDAVQPPVADSANGNPIGNQLFVAVGSGGALVTSTDGFIFNTITSGTASSINGVHYAFKPGGANTYIFVGTGGVLSTSTDGVDWISQSSNTTGQINAVTSNADMFMYVGNGAAGAPLIRTSQDSGVTWDWKVSNTTSTLWSMIYAGGKYVAVGQNGAITISNDAITWTSSNSDITGTTTEMRAVAYGANTYVYASRGGILGTSTDATTWVTITGSQMIPPLTAAWDFYALDYGKGVFCAAGAEKRVTVTDTRGPHVRVSTDATNWYLPGIAGANSAAVTASTPLASIYANGLHLVAGNEGWIATSTDGKIYSLANVAMNTVTSINEIAYHNGLYAYVASAGQIATSTDGVEWTQQTSNTASNLIALIYANGWLAGGAGGVLRSSTDGFEWANVSSGTTSIINDIAYSAGDDLYVMVGGGGMIRTSTDGGQTWDTRTSGTASAFNKVEYANGVFIAGGARVKAVSTDGISWTANAMGAITIFSIVYSSSDGIWLEGYQNAVLNYSTDNGTTWTQVPQNGYNLDQVRAMHYDSGNNAVYMYASGGGTFKSLDSEFGGSKTNWGAAGARSYWLSNGVFDITYTNNRFLLGTGRTWQVAGYAGAISDDGYWWMPIVNTTLTNQTTFDYASNGAGYAMVGGSSQLRTSTDGITWVSQTPASGHSGTFQTIEFSPTSNTYVYAGPGGQIGTSTDGVTWTSVTAGTSSIIYKVSYLDNKYYAVGAGGIVMRSEDESATWQHLGGRTSLVGNLLDVKYVNFDYSDYSNGVYIAGGATGYVLTSNDGFYWTPRPTGNSNQLNAVHYSRFDNNYYVAGASGTMLKSANLISWTTITTGTTSSIRTIGVPYASQDLYFAGEGGLIRYSNDSGDTWQTITSLTSSIIYRLVYQSANQESSRIGDSNNDPMYYFGTSGIIGKQSMKADSELTFAALRNKTALTSSSAIQSITYGDTAKTANNQITGVYLIAGISGFVASSVDGYYWIPRTSNTASTINDISYANGLFFYGTNGTSVNNLRYSSNGGENWSNSNFGVTATIRDVTYGNGIWLAVADGDIVRTSTDNSTWNESYAGPIGNIVSAEYSNVTNEFMITSSTGVQKTSTDGFFWYTHGSETANSLAFATYTNERFFYGGAGGIVATSTDGYRWARANTFMTNVANGVAYGLSNYVLVSDGGVVKTSTDVLNWANVTSGTATNIHSVAYGNGTFVFVGFNGILSTSTDDGVTWSSNIQAVATNFKVVYGSNNEFVVTRVTTAGGSVITSVNGGVTWSNNDIYYTGSSRPLHYNPIRNFYVVTTPAANVSSFEGSIVKTTLSPLNANGALNTWKGPGTNKTINRIVYDQHKDQYVYAGVLGTLATSTNGKYWVPVLNVTTSTIFSLAYGANTYVFGTANGGAFTSTDGANTWVQRISGTATTAASSTISTMTYGNNVFLYGSQNRIYSSPDPTQLYANGYNTATEFYVPDLTVGNTVNVSTDALYSIKPQPIKYIKAR